MKYLPCLVIGLAACGTTGGHDGTDGGDNKTDGRPGDGNGGHDGTTNSDGGGTPSAVTIIVEPNGNRASELVSAINAAQHSVYMTMYQIDDQDILTALTGRASAGLDVEAVLDSSTTNKSGNTPAYNALNSAHASAVWSSSAFTFTHQKTVIIDDKVAWIMTMNANTSSPEDNREYLAIDTTAADIAEATAVFKADHALQTITPSGSLVVADSNARAKIVALINTATKTLDVEGEEFSDTDSNGVVDAVDAAAKRGVLVHVIIGNASPDAPSIADVKAAGGHVVVTGPTSGNGTATNPYIHAKAVVVDCEGTTCTSAFVGSENFSAGSLGYNRELGVIFDETSEIAKVKAAIDTDFAAGVVQ